MTTTSKYLITMHWVTNFFKKDSKSITELNFMQEMIHLYDYLFNLIMIIIFHENFINQKVIITTTL